MLLEKGSWLVENSEGQNDTLAEKFLTAASVLFL